MRQRLSTKIQLQKSNCSLCFTAAFSSCTTFSWFLQSNFYRFSAKVGSGKRVEVEQWDADITFTVDSLLSVSQETINDVRTGVDAVLAADSEGRRIVALERLQETFF